ncbi:MAG: helix-turn-helix transcriptional regulator [Rothia sp. (in: high G+C Gram-positive bacteria)]|uniref:helix-turn-helix domain-containing protein n=1 Tax=Rothia sp. (in: high G+C Gram-positive bacteria) TaxID=1885016 RepID=UPI0026DC2207|nr:helix-turn-helix transcriptional regulator [Rothia sp. (in: high G+C Gram-positive bacteria)]MDO4884308.1 helix-turn-helix transcriptional regulator [Rothia sp. (in: high G+C Gram-positive bacteria)]
MKRSIVDEMYEMRPFDREQAARLAEDMRKEVRLYRLRELREQAELTQQAMARELRVSQNSVSKLERGDLDRTQMSTLKKYVEALGGSLKVEATFGDTSYRIS